MIYDKKYYTTSNYEGYLDKGEKYKKTATEICNLLKQINVINTTSRILDFGCAVGFLCVGLQSLGYENVFGYDISEWATSQAKTKGVNIVDTPEGFWDLVFCLDVLEHMTDEDILDMFNYASSDSYLVRIPCSRPGEDTYVLDVSNNDPTHINCKSKEEWIAFFQEHFGFKVILPISTYTVYDSEGVMCALLLK